MLACWGQHWPRVEWHDRLEKCEEYLMGNDIDNAGNGETADSVYIKAVTELGDTQSVVTNREINSRTGIKLVNEGVRIDSTFYERLVQHKLVPALEQCLTVENAVSTRSLIEASEGLLNSDIRLGRLSAALTKKGTLRQVLSQLELVPPLAFKLTVAREKRPEIYEHSLRVMLISLYLGVASGMRVQELIALIAAALFHDLGVLHIDPDLFDRSHQLTEDERRHLYAHPLSAYIMLSEFPEYHPHVSTAVLEHHERMDGSGYPRGVVGDKISRLAQVLAVAEVVASRYDRADQEKAWAELEVMLKLNARQFGTGLVGPLAVLYRPEGEESGEAASQAVVRQQLDRVAQVFERWEQAYGPMQAGVPAGGMLGFVNDSLASLKLALYDAGLNPRELEQALGGNETDPRGHAELLVLASETVWQVSMLIREVKRRWPVLGEHPEEGKVFAKWADEVTRLLEPEGI